MNRRTPRIFPLAYHISIQAYGRWLPGDPRGWHQRGDGATASPRPGNVSLHAISRELQRHPTATLSESIRGPIAAAIASVAQTRGWTIHALAMIDSHAHLVIKAEAAGVETLRAIREETVAILASQELLEPSRPLWSNGGYFSMIHTIAGLDLACRYVDRHRARPSP
jgi:hypothetical protein